MPGHVRDRGRRADGTIKWQARWRHPSDQRVRVERVFRRKRDAERWLARQETDAFQGTYIAPRDAERRFADVYEAWKGSWPGRLERTTTERYEQIWDRYLREEFGDRKTNLITHEVVQRYVDGLRDSGKGPATVRKVHSVLSAAFTEAVRLGIVSSHPCRHVRLPRSPQREQLFASTAQVGALAEAIDPHFRTLIYTAAYTGLRAGELAALQRADLDLLHRTLTVRRSVKYLKTGVELGPTKTHAIRRVKLPGFLSSMLDEHLVERGPGPDDLVFTGKRGSLLHQRPFYRRHYKPAVRAALPPELDGFRFHDLRHTCAALLLSQGAHLLAVKEQLGHRSIVTTIDHYGHLAPGLADSLAEKLDAAYEAVGKIPANVAPLRP